MPRSRTVPSLLSELAERHPDVEFVVGGGRRLRYPEFEAEARRFARGLHALGVRRGDKVAILMGNRPEWLVADFAILALGAVMVSLNTWATRRELAWMLDHSDTSVLVTVDRFLGQDYTGALLEIGADEGLAKLRRIVRIAPDDRELPGGVSWDEVLAAGEEVPEGVVAAAEAAVEPADVACILYTSGSTSTPKGVQLQHYALIENMWHIGERQHLRAGDRLWLAVSLFWGLGCENALFALMTHAGTVVLQERFEAGEAIDLIEGEGCTVVYATPNMVRAMAEHPEVPAGASREPSHRGHDRYPGTGPPPRRPRGPADLQRLRAHGDLRELHRHRCARPDRAAGRFGRASAPGIRARHRGSGIAAAPARRRGRRDQGPRIRDLRLLPGRGQEPRGVRRRGLVPHRRPRLPRRVGAALLPGASQGDDQDRGHQRGAGGGGGGPDVAPRRRAGVRRRPARPRARRDRGRGRGPEGGRKRRRDGPPRPLRGERSPRTSGRGATGSWRPPTFRSRPPEKCESWE